MQKVEIFPKMGPEEVGRERGIPSAQISTAVERAMMEVMAMRYSNHSGGSQAREQNANNGGGYTQDHRDAGINRETAQRLGFSSSRRIAKKINKKEKN